MCCFTGPVSSVDNTRIFARWLAGAKPPRQVIAYQMDFKAKRGLAMVLPLPVPPDSGEKAVEFLNLEKAPDFFKRLHALFPEPASAGSFSRAPGTDQAKPKKLEVVKVGSFEASFVPSLADFGRLDERFRMGKGVWEQLPQYKDWGFAVFKLRPDTTTVHPMAFSFPNSLPGSGLFFPTVHIHDGRVHPEEEFDHTLFCQVPSGRHGPSGWQESEKWASSVGKIEDAGLLDRSAHVYRKFLSGKLPNRDTWA
ncbi:MAG: hypothetical protein EOP86_08495 [Verrucomicrobiaceae bacterium]|nr:MAG: hypothetical protein EOP86_08495 [Verrucomicrobiaceae bacterium]